METCVHPKLDVVAVRIESPLVASGDLEVVLEFAYPNLDNGGPWVGDFNRSEGHATTESGRKSFKEPPKTWPTIPNGTPRPVSIRWIQPCRPATGVHQE